MADTTHEPTDGDAALKEAPRQEIDARDYKMAGDLVDGLQDAPPAELPEAKDPSPSSSPHNKPVEADSDESVASAQSTSAFEKSNPGVLATNVTVTGATTPSMTNCKADTPAGSVPEMAKPEMPSSAVTVPEATTPSTTSPDLTNPPEDDPKVPVRETANPEIPSADVNVPTATSGEVPDPEPNSKDAPTNTNSKSTNDSRKESSSTSRQAVSFAGESSESVPSSSSERKPERNASNEQSSASDNPVRAGEVLPRISDQPSLTEPNRTEAGGEQPVPEHEKHQETQLSTLPPPGTSGAGFRGQNARHSLEGEEDNHETEGVVEQGASQTQKQMQKKAQRSAQASKQMAYDVFDWTVGSVEILERYQDEQKWKDEDMKLSPTSKEMLDNWSKGETQVTAEVVLGHVNLYLMLLQVQMTACHEDIRDELRQELTEEFQEWLRSGMESESDIMRRVKEQMGKALRGEQPKAVTLPDAQAVSEADVEPTGSRLSRAFGFLMKGFQNTDAVDAEYRKNPDQKAKRTKLRERDSYR